MLDVCKNVIDDYGEYILVDNSKNIEGINLVLKKLYNLMYYFNIFYLKKSKNSSIVYSGRNYNKLKRLQKFYNSLGYATIYKQPFLSFDEFLTIYSKDIKTKNMTFYEKMEDDGYLLYDITPVLKHVKQKNIKIKKEIYK